jgi:inhibitor of KinA
MEFTRIYSIHDQAITFEFAEMISEAINIHVIALQKYIESHPFEGLIECVPAYSSLTIYFSNKIESNRVIHYIKNCNEQLTPDNLLQVTEMITIPVCYELGEDLPSIASELNIQKEEIIQLHSSRVYRVYMIGFTPGFPYMGILPPALELPRKKIPALRIPAGSVAIAGKQTGIYPSDSPGGWNIIGKTPIDIYDRNRHPRYYLRAGDQVKFQPISIKEFDQYK